MNFVSVSSDSVMVYMKKIVFSNQYPTAWPTPCSLEFTLILIGKFTIKVEYLRRYGGPVETQLAASGDLNVCKFSCCFSTRPRTGKHPFE